MNYLKRDRLYPWLLTADVAERIVRGEKRVSLDLEINEVDIFSNCTSVILPDGFCLNIDDLKKISEHKDSIYFVQGNSIFQAAISDDHYYKLVPTIGAPTVEVDGIRMHRTKGITPEVDALAKVQVLGVDGGLLFDTCTGLGYTALTSLQQGCESIVSVELKPQILRLAQLNPWSHGLFENDFIHLVLGDVGNIVEYLPETLFDFIIHDPPRFSHAGHLYSRRFYIYLNRILKPGGYLFHYVGLPGARYRRIDLRKGVINRLRQTGFVELDYKEEVLGVVCKKPRRKPSR